jgi:hypothetical protein
MTVNERLYESGLFNEFDRAIKQKDIDKAISILQQVELTEPSITPILERLGLNPKR